MAMRIAPAVLIARLWLRTRIPRAAGPSPRGIEGPGNAELRGDGDRAPSQRAGILRAIGHAPAGMRLGPSHFSSEWSSLT